MFKPSTYTIPKNKCQWCYNTIGRFILDCYCIVCEYCFQQRFHLNKGKCHMCQKPTNSKFFDGKDPSQTDKITGLFGNVEQGFNKMFQVYRFQQQIANRYCKFLQNRVAKYKTAIDQLVALSPQLQDFFNSRINNRDNKTQKRSISGTHKQLAQQPTIKQNKTQKLINYGMVSRQNNQRQIPQQSDIIKNKNQNNQSKNMKESQASQISMYSRNSNKQFFGPPNNFNYGSAIYANQAQKNFNRVQSKQLYNIHPNQKKFSAKNNPKVPYINLNTAQKSAKSDEKRDFYKNYEGAYRNQKKMPSIPQNYY